MAAALGIEVETVKFGVGCTWLQNGLACTHYQCFYGEESAALAALTLHYANSGAGGA